MKCLRALAFCALAALAPAGWAVDISGGGTNVLSAAITANSTGVATLIITDSLTYTESAELFLGPRYNGTRRSISIEAAPGQTPTIVLNGSRFVMYSGSADLRLGSNAGGKITVDATGASSPAFWYIGQEDGLASGQACQATVENTEFLFGNVSEPIIFGAGGNDGTPQTTSASLTLDNVIIRDGGVQVRALYSPASYASSLTIANSFFYNAKQGINIENGAYGLGGAGSRMVLDHTIVYNEAGSTGSGDPNALLQHLGVVEVDHSDIVGKWAPNLGRAVCVTGGNMAITNSIVYGAGYGTANLGSGTATQTDSNIVGGDEDTAGFISTNVIRDWPNAYWSLGTDADDPNQFAVVSFSPSRTHGTSPPLGSRGAASVPVEISTFGIE